MYMTYDGGATWENLHTVWGQGSWNTLGIGQLIRVRYSYPDKDGKNVLMISLSDCNRSNRISYDNGKTFETLYEHMDMTNETTEAWTGWYCGAIATTPSNPDMIATAWNSIAVSYDHAKTFSMRNSGISGALINDFEFDEDGRIKYVGFLDFGIAKRVEGYDGDFPPMEIVHKFPTMDGGSKSATSIVRDPSDPNHVISITGAGFTYGFTSYLVDSYDDMNTFRIYSGMRQRMIDIQNSGGGSRGPEKIKYSKTNPDVIYANWFVSEDHGKMWRETTVNVKDISPFDGDVCYGFDSSSELVVSYDRARTWKKTGMKFENYRELVADVHEPYVVYIPMHVGGVVYKVDLKAGTMEMWNEQNGLYVLDKDGNKYTPEIGFQMRLFAQDPKNAKHMLVAGMDFYATKNYLFESYDGGKSWFNVQGIPGGCGIGWLEFHPTEPRVYIGSSQGAYVYYFENYGMEESE